METTRDPASKITWTARFLGILFAAFISIFAMDVFTEGYDLKDMSVALVMHMLPALLIILVLIISWHREWIGGIVFLGIGLVYLYVSWGKMDWYGIALISVPLFILSGLFFFGWAQRSQQMA